MNNDHDFLQSQVTALLDENADLRELVLKLQGMCHAACAHFGHYPEEWSKQMKELDNEVQEKVLEINDGE